MIFDEFDLPYPVRSYLLFITKYAVVMQVATFDKYLSSIFLRGELGHHGKK